MAKVFGTERGQGSFQRWRNANIAILTCATALGLTGAAYAQLALNPFAKSEKLRDQKLELSMKIKQPFTVVAVGDMLQMTPFSKIQDPDIQYLVQIMRGADLTLANNENIVVDHTTFRGPIAHLEAPTTVADDWANMGIDIVNKANNHTWDAGEDGLWQNFHQLDRVGIAHVGADYNLTEARMARGVTTSKGTAAMVGVYADNDLGQLTGLPVGHQTVYVTADQLRQLRDMRDSIVARRKEVTDPIMLPASDPDGEVVVFGLDFKTGSKPVGTEDQPSTLQKMLREALSRQGTISAKTNTLGLTTYNGVTAAQMGQLRAIAGDSGSGDVLDAFGVHFKIMPGPGEYSYDMSVQQERDILREVRSGKQIYDFEAATAHWHQNRYAYQQYSFDHYPADFEIKFAHDAIDQGADLFFGHGVHTIKGIEIYKGKPIFYGLSNYVLQEEEFHSWRDRGVQKPTPLEGPIVGDAEQDEEEWGWMEKPGNFETLLTSSHYENGKLVEVRIYPVDLGDRSRPGSQLGTPRRASPDVANRILHEVAEYSMPFGTKIVIENGVGIIRP